MPFVFTYFLYAIIINKINVSMAGSIPVLYGQNTGLKHVLRDIFKLGQKPPYPACLIYLACARSFSQSIICPHRAAEPPGPNSACFALQARPPCPASKQVLKHLKNDRPGFFHTHLHPPVKIRAKSFSEFDYDLPMQ